MQSRPVTRFFRSLGVGNQIVQCLWCFVCLVSFRETIATSPGDAVSPLSPRLSFLPPKLCISVTQERYTTRPGPNPTRKTHHMRDSQSSALPVYPSGRFPQNKNPGSGRYVLPSCACHRYGQFDYSSRTEGRNPTEPATLQSLAPPISPSLKTGNPAHCDPKP